jgi:protein TonB
MPADSLAKQATASTGSRTPGPGTRSAAKPPANLASRWPRVQAVLEQRLSDRRVLVAVFVALAHVAAIWAVQQSGGSPGMEDTVVMVEVMSDIIAPPTPNQAEQVQTAPKHQPVQPQPTPPKAETPPPLQDAPAAMAVQESTPQPTPEAPPIDTPTVAAESAAPPPAQRTQGASADPSPLSSNRSPSYPRVSRERNEQGSGVISLRVDASGKVIEAEIGTSSGYVLLDRAALNTFRRWRFKPGLVDGKPAERWVNQPFVFELDKY